MLDVLDREVCTLWDKYGFADERGQEFFARAHTKPFAIITEGRETNNDKHTFMFAKYDGIISQCQSFVFWQGQYC